MPLLETILEEQSPSKMGTLTNVFLLKKNPFNFPWSIRYLYLYVSSTLLGSTIQNILPSLGRRKRCFHPRYEQHWEKDLSDCNSLRKETWILKDLLLIPLLSRFPRSQITHPTLHWIFLPHQFSVSADLLSLSKSGAVWLPETSSRTSLNGGGKNKTGSVHILLQTIKLVK